MKRNREIKMNQKLYGASPEREWERLQADEFHRLEYEGTVEMIEKHIPEKGLILDAGGGPGRYSLYAAEKGYKTVLLDIAKENLELAKKKAAETKSGKNILSYIHGSIDDLSMFDDSVFDAVLCLGGPLSHVYPEKRRLKALKEFSRVAKKKAPIFVSVMSYYGVILATPMGWPQEVKHKEYYERFIETGDDYRFASQTMPGYCHFFKSDELRKLASRAGLKETDSAGLECMNIDMDTSNKFAKEHPEEWERWKQINDKLRRESFVTDASGHFIKVFKRI